MMEFRVVVVVVDSKDKYTKKEENVSNHEHLQFNHNIDHHHTRKTPCAALYDERYVHTAIAEGVNKQHPCPASSSSSSSWSRGVVMIDGAFGIVFGVVVVVVDSKDKYTKRSNVSNHEHLQFNHNIDHHQHTQNAMCPALC